MATGIEAAIMMIIAGHHDGTVTQARNLKLNLKSAPAGAGPRFKSALRLGHPVGPWKTRNSSSTLKPEPEPGSTVTAPAARLTAGQRVDSDGSLSGENLKLASELNVGR